jgi:hypothetical protein
VRGGLPAQFKNFRLHEAFFVSPVHKILTTTAQQKLTMTIQRLLAINYKMMNKSFLGVLV